MKEIPLTKGQVAKVCDCHYHLVKDYKWCALWNPCTKSYYAQRATTIVERFMGAPSTAQMHRIINNTPKGVKTDHADHDTLNNQCSNLRDATTSQNAMNRKNKGYNSTGFKGVSFKKRSNKWEASVQINHVRKYVGTFDTPELAARAYDRKALDLHGEFAVLNFPREDYQS